MMLKIAILLITAYLMCLEGRSKYLYMFLPVYLVAFGLMFGELCDGVSTVHVLLEKACEEI